MGYKLAGCDVIAANDIDPEMEYHYRLNLDPRLYYLCPIKDLLTRDLPDELFDLDILDGSPPCSTFSMSGKREKDWGKDKHFKEGQAKQVLSDLFFDYLGLVERLKPKVAIAENVKGMLFGNAKGYTKEILRRFSNMGYNTQLFLINAADCGVPQKRERVFFCAVRDDIDAPSLKLSPNKPWVNSCAAIDDIDLTDQERRDCGLNSATDKKWWPLTQPGEDYGSAIQRNGLALKLWNHKKLHPKKPSNTLPAVDRIKHWNERRVLSFREWKRLGSFPDDYRAKNDKIGKYLIGMSVPPRMTEQVARAVCAQWLGVSYGNP